MRLAKRREPNVIIGSRLLVITCPYFTSRDLIKVAGCHTITKGSHIAKSYQIAQICRISCELAILGFDQMILGQFGTTDNLAPRTIWHRNEKRTIWHRNVKTDNLAPGQFGTVM